MPAQKQTEDFRRRPPEPLAPRPLDLPAAEAVTLANGLRVLFVESRRLPLVSFRLAFRSGDADDPADRSGLTDLMTGMLNEGTRSRTSRQIAEEVARIGATLSAGASADYTTVAASALSAYAGEILELMADITLRPTFPADELELTKQNTLQNLIAQRGQPSFLANERVSRVVYGGHPYSVVAPTPESIEAATRDELAEFHRARFIPNSAVFIVGGDFDRAGMQSRIEELFGDWPAGEARPRQSPAAPSSVERLLHLVDRPGSAQSNIVIANPGLTRTHPDYFPALVMHTVLGATASSRLFMNLREEKGYTYGAYTNLDARREAGSFRATAEVRTPVTGDSLKEFFYEFGRIREELATEKELTDAQTYLSGIFPIRLETLDGLIDQLLQIEVLGLPADYLQTYRDRIHAVTREEVLRVARRYVTPDEAAIVIVGDAAAVRPQAEAYARGVRLYDSRGQRKEQENALGDTNTGRGGDAAAQGQATTTGDAAGASAATGGASQTTADDAGASAGGAAAAATQAAGEQAGEGEAGELFGTWNLDVKTPFGQHPATLTLAPAADGSPAGDIKSQLGDAPLGQIRLGADSLEADISIRLQGRDFSARLSAQVSAGQMNGTIKVNNMPIAPALKFTGTKG